ncbi:hypothetical protein ACFPN2_09150 [Steroidobacter flavus]|uniref:Lipoprotein n=1 Tax=Steroidobacter flavus TaxID=1842136 RepID=A0ABV8SPJ8_9GAMM
MNSFRGAGLKVAFVAMLLTVGGCSRFFVYDTYKPGVPSGEPGVLRLVNEDMALQVSFVSDLRFASFGGVGLPVVPVAAGPTSRPRKIEMNLLVTLPGGRPFSIAPVCLDPPVSRLCPQEVRVSNVSYFGKDAEDGRTRSVLDFFHPWTTNGKAPITDQDVFTHHLFRGKGPLQSVTVTLEYKYECGDRCPNEIFLSTDELLVVEGRQFGHGVQQLHWGRVKEYEPAMAIQ